MSDNQGRMTNDRLPHERLALIGLAALVIGIGAFVFVRSLHKPAPIVFQSEAVKENSSKPSAQVVVDVAGAVIRPGVLHLNADQRVDDAIRSAGGAAADADLESINLAAKLVDGSQVFVPRKGKSDPVAEPYQGGQIAEPYTAHPKSSESTRTGGKKHPSGPVSLNTGTAAQLQTLPGVGPSTAQRILEYRSQHGGFTSIDELMAVKGIGPKKLKALRKFLRL